MLTDFVLIHSWPDVISINKSRNVRCVGRVARMREIINAHRNLGGNFWRSSTSLGWLWNALGDNIKVDVNKHFVRLATGFCCHGTGARGCTFVNALFDVRVALKTGKFLRHEYLYNGISHFPFVYDIVINFYYFNVKFAFRTAVTKRVTCLLVCHVVYEVWTKSSRTGDVILQICACQYCRLPSGFLQRLHTGPSSSPTAGIISGAPKTWCCSPLFQSSPCSSLLVTARQLKSQNKKIEVKNTMNVYWPDIH
jgi:hypothetical protein